MKTPIAIIQNQCECVLENIAPEKNEEYLKSIYDETQKMDKLVTDMLQYNRIATNGNVNIEKCNLSDIVKAEVEKYKKQFELHEKNVTLNLKETAVVKCDRNLISLVVDNMLSNTIKHTENGGEVIVTVKDSAEGYKVSVYNSGSTVPENEKDKIWSVLYKTDKSRTERDKSSGVGLAVSAKILDLHKANYGCENVKDGVKFYFSIR
jgi:signal transduction histidine kinase